MQRKMDTSAAFSSSLPTAKWELSAHAAVHKGIYGISEFEVLSWQPLCGNTTTLISLGPLVKSN